MKGFTLVEVLIVVVMVGLLSGALAMILLNNTNLQTQQSASVEQGVGSNDALLDIRSSIKESLAVVANYPVSGTPVYTTSSNVLVLQLPSISATGDVITTAFDYVVYVVESNLLKVKVFPDASSSRNPEDKILSKNVESATFSYYDALGAATTPTSAVKISITLDLSQTSGNQVITNTNSTEVNLRND